MGAICLGYPSFLLLDSSTKLNKSVGGLTAGALRLHVMKQLMFDAGGLARSLQPQP